MPILINKNTRFIIQGITGTQGSFHAKLMQEYAAKALTAGVTPGKGGQEIHEIPVYNSVKEALDKHEATWSAIFVPAAKVKDAAKEALENGLNLVIISEHVPVLDTIKIVEMAQEENLHVVGPNCPGIITPEEIKIGIMPDHVFRKGKVGVVSRSGTLTYEIVDSLTKVGIGQSTVIGIGGDPIVGMDFTDILPLFEKDSETEKIVLIGEIGGDNEERAARYIKDNISKPVVAYIAGKTAPVGKTMGHAGALISGKSGTAESKIKALQEVGTKVAVLPSLVAEFLY